MTTSLSKKEPPANESALTARCPGCHLDLPATEEQRERLAAGDPSGFSAYCADASYGPSLGEGEVAVHRFCTRMIDWFVRFGPPGEYAIVGPGNNRF